MVGRTNACSGGGSSSQWYAFIQVSTDANVQISAVNLHGDAYTGTATSSGSLILTVHEPGTYTVSETGGGTATVVVADYGVAYSVSVYSFVGDFIRDGQFAVSMTPMAIKPSYIQGQSNLVTPTIRAGVVMYSTTYVTFEINSSVLGSVGMLLTTQKIDVTSYDYLTIQYGEISSSTFLGFGVFDNLQAETIDTDAATMVNYSEFSTRLNISSVSGEKYIGIFGLTSNTTDIAYIENMFVE